MPLQTAPAARCWFTSASTSSSKDVQADGEEAEAAHIGAAQSLSVAEVQPEGQQPSPLVQTVTAV